MICEAGRVAMVLIIVIGGLILLYSLLKSGWEYYIGPFADLADSNASLDTEEDV